MHGLARWLADARSDTAYAVRSLAKSPAFTAAAVLTLAVGIGATTAIYTVVDSVLLQPLPFPDADRVVRIAENERPRTMPGVNHLEYLDWQSRTTTLSGLAAAAMNPQVKIRTPAGLVRVTGGIVSPNYFEVLGASARLGRTILAADAASPDVIVLGFYTWQRHFGSDPGVIGSVVDLRGSGPDRAVTIVGVMPEAMETVGAPFDVYLPLVPVPGRGPIGLGMMVGRLRPGVALAAASEEADRIGSAVRPARPASAPPLTGRRFEAVSLKDGIVAPLRPALRIFLGAVAAVLAIACANVASLLLARGTSRRRELATRLALGATRGRLARQVLAECAVLAAAGGLLGAAGGAAWVQLVKSLATIGTEGVFRIVLGSNILPRANEVGVDLRFFGIVFAFAAAATALFGLVPALHLSRADHVGALGSRGAGTARSETRIRTALVIGQVAMAMTLLVGAALLVTSFVRIATVAKGYDANNVLAFQLVLPPDYPTARKAQTIESILAEVRAMPEVAAAGFAYAGIFVGVQDTVGSFVPPGRALEDVAQDPNRPRLKTLSAGYLDAAGVRVLDGRLLRDSDAPGAAPVAVINDTVRRRYFGDANPVGSFLEWHRGGGRPARVQVVGVIADVRQSSLEREPYAEVFMEYRQVMALLEGGGAPKGQIEHVAFGFMSFALRTRGNPADTIPAVRRAIARVDAGAGLDAILPLDRLVHASIARQRFSAVVLGMVAAVAALLAAIGIYGVLAYAVAQRTQEIGLRMALGAGRRQVLLLILRRGLWCAAIGIVLGLAGAAAGTRYLQSMLYGVTPLDLGTFVLVAAAFSVVAALASYLPARRATKVDPMLALRAE